MGQKSGYRNLASAHCNMNGCWGRWFGKRPSGTSKPDGCGTFLMNSEGKRCEEYIVAMADRVSAQVECRRLFSATPFQANFRIADHPDAILFKRQQTARSKGVQREQHPVASGKKLRTLENFPFLGRHQHTRRSSGGRKDATNKAWGSPLRVRRRYSRLRRRGGVRADTARGLDGSAFKCPGAAKTKWVKITVGSGGNESTYPHGAQALDFELLVKFGELTPLRALQSGTIVNLEVMGWKDRVWSIEAASMRIWWRSREIRWRTSRSCSGCSLW